MTSEHDRVVLREDLDTDPLRAGDVGTVIHVYADRGAYEVEFVSLDGKTVAVATVPSEKLRPVRPNEIASARAVA